MASGFSYADAFDRNLGWFTQSEQQSLRGKTVANDGQGGAFLVFSKDGMAFEDYFRFEGKSELRQYIHFLMGVAPSAMHRAYLVERSRLDIARRKAPSTMIGVELCAAHAAAQVVKIL